MGRWFSGLTILWVCTETLGRAGREGFWSVGAG